MGRSYTFTVARFRVVAGGRTMERLLWSDRDRGAAASPLELVAVPQLWRCTWKDAWRAPLMAVRTCPRNRHRSRWRAGRTSA